MFIIHSFFFLSSGGVPRGTPHLLTAAAMTLPKILFFWIFFFVLFSVFIFYPNSIT